MQSTRSPRRAIWAPVALSTIGLVACQPGIGPGLASTAALSAARPGSLQSCEALAASLVLPNTRMVSSERVAVGALKQGERALPEHCLVKGRMHERKGADGRDYAIGFEMRLPMAWNGRFYYQGNGGLDGSVQPALGALGGGPLTGALMQGFAVISSDAGHSGPQTPIFGLEPQARLDYGHQAVAKLTPMAKDLIRAAYGRAPDRSYIGGCSNGGRHTMVAAARLGEQYDGYLIGAPGYRLPNAALVQLWGAQQWAPLATPGATTKHPMNPRATIPDLGGAFTAQERATLAQAVLNKCDALDGARDGMVQATQACQAVFRLDDVPTCSAARNGSCLSPAQKQVVAAVYAGGRTASGQAIYSAFPWDAGVAGSNWAEWKFDNAIALDPLAVGTVFTAPAAGKVDPFNADVSVLLAQMGVSHDSQGSHRESGLSLMTPPGHENPVNLTPLRERGAKMVLFHGVSDPIFSAEDTRQWLERLNRAQAGRADDMARYFPVPGMNHCSGGLATDQFDLLTPLVQWVEQGIKPQAVLAQVRGAGHSHEVNTELPAAWSAQRSRPLCAYPTVAQYKGTGSLEEAGNFVCRQP